MFFKFSLARPFFSFLGYISEQECEGSPACSQGLSPSFSSVFSLLFQELRGRSACRRPGLSLWHRRLLGTAETKAQTESGRDSAPEKEQSPIAFCCKAWAMSPVLFPLPLTLSSSSCCSLWICDFDDSVFQFKSFHLGSTNAFYVSDEIWGFFHFFQRDLTAH